MPPSTHSRCSSSLGPWLRRYLCLSLRILGRKKTVDDGAAGGQEGKLSRCLGTVDLVALGVGSTLGAGVYVIAGEVAQKTTGPAVILAFFIAAAASVLAGLCYAEFGALVPKSGSAYAYSYVSVGELMAFVIGWNLILEYAIGAASVARAWSQNLDSLAGGKIIGAFRTSMPMSLPGLAEYPDFLALAIILTLTVIVAVGVKESAWITKVFTLVNLIVLSMVFVAGLWLADIANWQVQPGVNGTVEYANLTFSAAAVGNGGFLPFGPGSIVSGAGTCFYAFVGFDAIATTGEEVSNPQRSIPLSIILSLLICFFAYFGLSSVLTLMLPYFALDPLAPLPAAFSAHGWSVANYVIAVGAVCALSTSLLGAMIPLPRIVYAMASDGLIFRSLARVEPRLKTPLIATLITGCLAGLMSCVFELKELVDMMSIGTLLAYTLVAVSVVILRGSMAASPLMEEAPPQGQRSADAAVTDGGVTDSSRGARMENNNNAVAAAARPSVAAKLRFYMIRAFRPASDKPTKTTETITCASIGIFMLASALLALLLVQLETFNPGVIVAIIACLTFCLLLVVSLHRQPQCDAQLSFRVPWVPWLPCISIVINLYLMMALSAGTWLRFGVWMASGFAIYLAYGIWHSTENKVQTQPWLRRDRARRRQLLLPETTSASA